MNAPPKITYTSTSSSEELHQAFESALEEARRTAGGLRPNSISGRPSAGSLRSQVRSPIDRRLLVGEVQQADRGEVAAAVEAAHAAFPAWRRAGWRRRTEVVRQAAELIAERRFELAALMALEVGKTRLEALGEVEESADLLRYYAGLLEESRGFARDMARLHAAESTQSVLLPYGVFGVIAPFNFPLALPAGMIAAALLAGNTVVFKPSEEAPLIGAELCRALWESGVPPAALHFVAGLGEEAGAALVSHRRTAGIAFTGSYEVGMSIYRQFSHAYPKPMVVEMGGKNAALISASADLEAAAEGVARSAFGFGGQKCSACSRVYVVEEVAQPFIERLLAASERLTVGNPLLRSTFLGPLISERALERFAGYVSQIRDARGRLLLGGASRRDGELAHGPYAEPTIAVLDDHASPLFAEEMFVPLLLVATVRSLEEALAQANHSQFGLTAGLFSGDAAEVERFLEGIEAGVLYVNRRSGATTGAWPGVNPFGGWKASGGTGVAALGPYYLLKFLREQSRTVNEAGA
jgi:1-pyrroline-5-carboxylate dehydrogenase